MSISPLLPLAPAVPSIAARQEQAQYIQNRQSDLGQLGEALQSGDLAGAQQQFAAIQTLAQNGPFRGSAFAETARQQDFTAIGEALQSGNLAGAQQAFAQLQSTFKSGENSANPTSAQQVSGNISADERIVLDAAENNSATSSSPQASGVNEVA